jgi:hypothetical protein
MEDQAKSPRQTWRCSSGEDPIRQLADLQSILTDLLGAVDGDPRSLDASSERAHKLVADICRLVKHDVFGPDGPLDSSVYKQAYDAFTATREAENDMYEVYANDLECYRRRAVKALGVAESDSDRLALVKRRREYIPRLLALHAQTKAILDYLPERRSAS